MNPPKKLGTFNDEQDKLLLKCIDYMKDKGNEYQTSGSLIWETIEKSGIKGLLHRTSKSLKTRYNNLKKNKLNLDEVDQWRIDNLIIYMGLKRKKENLSRKSVPNKSVANPKNNTPLNKTFNENNENLQSDDPITQNPSIFDTPNKENQSGKEDVDEKNVEDSQEKSKEYGTNQSLRESLQKQKPSTRSPSPSPQKENSSKSSGTSKNDKNLKRKLIYRGAKDTQVEKEEFSTTVDNLCLLFDTDKNSVLKAFYMCGGSKKKVEQYFSKPKSGFLFPLFLSFFFKN